MNPTMMDTPNAPLDILLVSGSALWPLDQGFKVHGLSMARHLMKLGLRVGIASLQTPPTDLPDDYQHMQCPWPKPTRQAAQQDIAQLKLAWRGAGQRLRLRLADYQGLDLAKLAGVIALDQKYQPKVVLGIGIESVMLLAALPANEARKRVWYAADELVRYHFTCMRHESMRYWPVRLRNMAHHLLMERCFGHKLEGVIGVSDLDSILLKYVAGIGHHVTIQNGVDLDYYQPAKDTTTAPTKSLVFWGRMDFEPNIDAACWFAKHIWPSVIKQHPHATLQFVGKKPTERVTQLNNLPGISVIGPVADIRPYARQASVVILPMRCGGGIKNKLLEAAAMARPMLVSPRAADGLTYDKQFPPFQICKTQRQWLQKINQLWQNPTLGTQLGQQARQWVKKSHNWEKAAAKLADWLGVEQKQPLGGGEIRPGLAQVRPTEAVGDAVGAGGAGDIRGTEGVKVGTLPIKSQHAA